jgi:hypothetical protein
MAEKPNTRDGGYCIECGHEVDTFDGLDSCPACGSTSIPCAWSNEVTITVNWHALRILVIWAENWQRAKTQSRTVYSIAKRIKAQHPDLGPLTLAEELGEVAEKFPGVAVNQPDLRRDIAEQTGHEVNLIRPDDASEIDRLRREATDV